MPFGRWGPKQARARFGAQVTQIRPHWIAFAFAPTLQTNAIAFLAAIPVEPGAWCTAQFVSLIVVVALFAVLVACARPDRIPAMHVMRVASSVALMTSIGASLWLLRADASSRGSALSLGATTAIVMTILAALQLAHLLALKILEKTRWTLDGRTHIWLDGVPMKPHADEEFNEGLVPMLPRFAFSGEGSSIAIPGPERTTAYAEPMSPKPTGL